jgi:hypothetical protein
MVVSAKFILFITGLVATLASIVGMLIAFDAMPAFLAILPTDVRIYFGITAVCGLIALGTSFSRELTI